MTTNYYKVNGAIYSASIKLVGNDLCVCTEREEPDFPQKNKLRSIEDFTGIEELGLKDKEQTFKSLGSMIYLKNSETDEFQISEKGKDNQTITKVPKKSIHQYKYNKEQKPKLVIGTMNIIGDAYNPIEFEPYLSKEDKKEYNKYKKTLGDKFNTITYGDIRDDLKEFDELFSTDTKAKGGAKSLPEEPTNADKFFKEKDIGKKEDFLNKKLIELFEQKENGINLQEDNKWGSDKRRLNPLVYALAPTGYDIKRIQKDNFSNTGYIKIYKNKLKEAYDKKLDDTKKEEKNLYLDLLLWDLFCCKLLQDNYNEHAGMCKYSYLCKTTGERIDKGDIFEKLFNPLLKLKKNNLQNDFIIGCQELPGNIDDINKIISDNFTIEKHGVSTGFIMSEGIEFENITEKAIGIFGDFQTQNKDIYTNNKKSFDTTKDKMFVGKFELNNKKEVIVANFHCKSFKENSKVQGELIKHILDELKTQNPGIEVFVVGDMNIEPQKKYKNGEAFIKEYIDKDDFKNKGKLPKENENLNNFNEGLTGYTIFPKIENGIGTITTLKQRTLFQGQPGKAGELNATQKDVVILPEEIDDAVVTLGGRPQEGIKDIMELLQPSREWPGDHFAIFTSFELKSTATEVTAEPTE